MVISDDILKAVKEKHGGVELHLFGNRHGQAVFRLPSEHEYQRFIDEQVNPETKGAAMKTLVISCAVYPEAAEFRSMIANRPGLVLTFGNELIQEAGLEAANVRKKL